MKIIEITSLGCMSCIVMDDRIQAIADKHGFDLEIINNDLEDASPYGTFDLFPVFIIYDKNNNELDRIQGEHNKSDLEAQLLGWKNA